MYDFPKVSEVVLKNSIKIHIYHQLVFNLLMTFTATAIAERLQVNDYFERYKKSNPLTLIFNISSNVHVNGAKKIGKGGYGLVFEASVKNLQGKEQKIVGKKALHGDIKLCNRKLKQEKI
jgi:hypothetical protein